MDQRLPKRLSELVPRTILKDDGAASCNNCHHSDRVSSCQHQYPVTWYVGGKDLVSERSLCMVAACCWAKPCSSPNSFQVVLVRVHG